MAIETSRNNRSVKISYKLSIHEQGGGKRVSPLGVPAVYQMVSSFMYAYANLACENIRFSSLFATGDVPPREGGGAI